MEGSRKRKVESFGRCIFLKRHSYVVPQYPQVEPEQMAEECQRYQKQSGECMPLHGNH